MQTIHGTVIHGKQLGRVLGFPTANIEIDCANLNITPGTRKCKVVIAGTTYLGVGPYFPDRGLFEVHILDFTGNLYGQEVVLYPLMLLRENVPFQDMKTLRTQIAQDLIYARYLSTTAMAFGTFDHLHPGHHHYLQAASQRGDELIVIIARDSTVQKLKGFLPTDDETTRRDRVAALPWVSYAQLGHTHDRYSCLDEHLPTTLCLGYDQNSFQDGVSAYCSEHHLPLPEIVRIEAHKPDQYKSSLYREG